MTDSIKIYGYRWIVLLVFAVLNILIQIQWVTFAPITTEAAEFYGVTPLDIGLLSMIFMIAYVVVCIPASYIIDSYGIRIGIGIGALLTGVFGFAKGIYGSDFTGVMISQVGLAVAQPFILNSYTKLGAKWFPINERATATGLAALAQYLGITIALAVTPYLTTMLEITGMLKFYGFLSAGGAVLFLVFIREEPPTPPHGEGEDYRQKVFEGIRHIFKQRDMVIILLIFFIGIGIFNAVTTWIEQIIYPRGFDSEQAGILGGLMMLGGIIGAAVLPAISDKMRRRRPLLILAMVCMIPGLAGLTFATSYWLLLVSGFVLGFFIMSAGPIGFQYGAELSHPAPESTSQGLILLSGQISGIIFIFGMDMFRSAETGSMAPFMVAFLVLTALNVFLLTRVRESDMIREG